MDFKLFSDMIDAMEKVIKGLSTLKDIPKKERGHYREIIGDTCVLLETAILLVAIRLGDILMVDDVVKFSYELQALENQKDWLTLERDVRLCQSLRVAGREMSSLWNNAGYKLAIHDSKEFMNFMNNLEYGEKALADYISEALQKLAQMGRKINNSPHSVDNVKRTVRGVKNALLKERQHLIAIQIKLIDEII